MDRDSERDGSAAQRRPEATPFATRLKQLRMLRGFRTARAFAQALGVDENRYTRWERGEVEPNVAMLGKIAEILGLPVDTLVGGGEIGPALQPGRAEGPGSGGRAAGLQEETAKYLAEKSPQELSHNLLIASRVYALSLLEQRIAEMSQTEINGLIQTLISGPNWARLSGQITRASEAPGGPETGQ
jgi:transcriptional regulator with XRE-family HTH domain